MPTIMSTLFSFCRFRAIFFLGILILGYLLAVIKADFVWANEPSPHSLVVRCDWFDRGNVASGLGYDNKYPCIVHGGKTPNFVEYDLIFPEDGKYRLDGLYAALESRPVTIFLDQQPLGKFFTHKTGAWQTSSAQWFEEVELEVSAGKHVLRLEQPHCFPHICAVRLTPLFPLKNEWPVPREIARQKALANEAKERPLPWGVAWFNSVAYDRRAKNESGQLFEDHFGAETVVALYPENSLDFSVITKREYFECQQVEGNRFDELTYTSALFKEAEVFSKENGVFDGFDPFLVCVKRIPKEETEKELPTGNPSLQEATLFSVGSERYELLIDKTEKLIHRLEHEFDWNELLANGFMGGTVADILARCQDERKNLADWKNLLNQTDQLPEQAKTVAKEMSDSFFRLIRIYWQMGIANPLLDFDHLLYVRRSDRHLGLVQNWESNSVLPVGAMNDSLSRWELSKIRQGKSPSSSFFTPEYPTFLGDLDLHFDAERLLFSSTNQEKIWNIFELDLTGSVVAPLTSTSPAATTTAATASITEAPSKPMLMKPLLPYLPEANNYDGCYLADDSILFNSSACYASVPCVNGSTRITNLFRQYKEGTIRRLTFDQEHNWCPSMMADGKVMYQRWEYTDIPHVPARLLFQMNPDGTGQTALYGSNSYWPNALFYARPIPGEPSQFIAVVGGHHGVRRMGELVLFDVRQGRKEAQGALMRICAKEKIVASRTDPKYDDTLIADNSVDESWPKFLHPYPFSSDYFFVASQLVQDGLWGLYLVDSDDNMFLLAQEKGFALFEPTPIRKTPRPPVLAERIDPNDPEATVFLADIYVGEGLKNVPRGTVKHLRLFTYNYLFPNMGGPQGTVGMDGPWDIKQVIGTVPVSSNGTAMFKVPANTPIALQPLDENGKELQLMRSWFTAMPGEVLSCIGCHEDANSVSPSSIDPGLITKTPLETITPWYGPTRGFSFVREVQPILDRYCISCHDGSKQPNDRTIFDLRGLETITDYSSVYHEGTRAGHFSTSYVELARFVRRPGMESDYHLLMPTEFSPETTDLYRHLVKGHSGLKIDAESWDRLLTWIDLNAPYFGYWSEQTADPAKVERWNSRRKNVLKMYANVLDDQEIIRPTSLWEKGNESPISTGWSIIPNNPLSTLEKSANDSPKKEAVALSPSWEFDSEEAKKRQEDCAEQLFGDRTKTDLTIELAPDVSLSMKLIPAGTFIMGAQSPLPNGSLLQPYDDETACSVTIDRPFWMGTLEVNNRLFELFDPTHDSGVESRYAMQFGVRGFYVNAPELPVVRVSWNEATTFCEWLSQKTGKKFRLPSEAQWEYACRAGTTSPFYYGEMESDFSPFENLADYTLREFICHPYFKERILIGGTKYDQWVPRVETVNDGGFLSEISGRYKGNPWGLFDMHGNVSEWTQSLARPYPYDDNDGRNAPAAEGQRVVRGGSWRDKPMTARSEYRWNYRPWQGVFNVGFRVVCEID